MIKKFVVIYRTTYSIVDHSKSPPRVVSYPTLKRAARRLARLIRVFSQDRDMRDTDMPAKESARLRDALFKCRNDPSHANAMNLTDLWNSQDFPRLYLVSSKHILYRVRLREHTVYDGEGRFVATFDDAREALDCQGECGGGATVRGWISGQLKSTVANVQSIRKNGK